MDDPYEQHPKREARDAVAARFEEIMLRRRWNPWPWATRRLAAEAAARTAVGWGWRPSGDADADADTLNRELSGMVIAANIKEEKKKK